VKQVLRISKTASVMIRVLAGLFAALLVVGLLVIHFIHPFERPLPYCVGLLLGHAISAVKVILLDKSINHALDMEGKQAKNYAGLQSILRYFLTIAVLLGAAFLSDFIGLFGVILGILSLQISAYIANAVLKKRSDLI